MILSNSIRGIWICTGLCTPGPCLVAQPGAGEPHLQRLSLPKKIKNKSPKASWIHWGWWLLQASSYWDDWHLFYILYKQNVCVYVSVSSSYHVSHIACRNSHRSKYVFPEKCPTSRCSAEDNELLLSSNSRRLAQRRLFLERSPVIGPFPR